MVTSLEPVVRWAGNLAIPPIFVFQMGKVGSTSLKQTLSKDHTGIVTAAHTYDMLTGRDKSVLKWRRRMRLPVYVICPIREPLSRNVSAFFQNFKRDTGYEYQHREWSASELRELFLSRYRHNVCLEWFDRQLRTVFDIDVFSSPFPVERKWKIYRRGPIRLLVYGSDMDRRAQLNVVSDFTGLNLQCWAYDNISESKIYSEGYKKFKSSVKLPDVYISMMCNSLFCRPFGARRNYRNCKKVGLTTLQAVV